MAGYDLEWTGTQLTGATRNDARPTGVPGSVLPQAYFSYSQGMGTTISFDASESVFDFVAGFEWDFGDGSFPGSGMTTSHTYAGPGTRTVKLVVREGSGKSAQTTRRVEVTDGRPPQIRTLTCATEPANPQGVLMDFTIFDEDADLERLEWYLDANAGSPAKTTPIDTSWDTWTSSDTLLYPDDGVQVYAPVLVVYDAGGNKDARACNPVSAIKVGATPLNDTGITWCANDTTNYLSCPVASHRGQDGEHGRDALARAGQLQKVGGGNAGFDFTKLDANGNALPASATQWDCVRDNHTGLIWEVKTTSGLRSMNHGYTWYDPNSPDGNPGVADGGNCTGSACDTTGFVQAVNAQGLCGASDWRMPTRRELQGIVDYGRYDPAIDTGYFPNTPSSYFWSASPRANLSSDVWFVYFNYGFVGWSHRSSYVIRIRLVRGGP